MFNQVRILLANIRADYNNILHENEDLRKLVTKLQNENDELKRNSEKPAQEVPTTES